MNNWIYILSEWSADGWMKAFSLLGPIAFGDAPGQVHRHEWANHWTNERFTNRWFY